MVVQTQSSVRRDIDGIAPLSSPAYDFVNIMTTVLERHRPSRMPFFRRFASLPRQVASNPLLLGKIHLNYQSAMHATRAAVYYLPHLDSPALRKRKLQIFIDDDGLPNGDTHHYQLTKAFLSIGAQCLLDDEQFGEPDALSLKLEAETAGLLVSSKGLFAIAWTVVCDRNNVCRLDAGTGRQRFRTFSGVQTSALFRRMLFTRG